MPVAPHLKASALEEIAAEIRAHRNCGFDLCAGAVKLVPGAGNPDAAVMLVGEAPGAAEDAAGVPFVGAAGRRLDDLLALAGLARDEVFVTNIVKARPPGNRDPRRIEVEHHLPWLEAQLEVIEPRLVVPLGRHALAHFAPSAALATHHGRVLETRRRRLFPMYHPAAALHNASLRPVLEADAAALGAALRSS